MSHTTVERSIEIELPVRTVYDQWTQFEDLPMFIDGLEKVVQENQQDLVWHVNVHGVDKEWRARITEQTPDQRIAWESVGDDPKHAGVVTFHHLDDRRSKVMLQFDFFPQGMLEQFADKTNQVEDYAETILKDFKSFIEERGEATGAWRGEIKREAA